MVGDWRVLTIDQIRSQSARSIAIGPFGSRMKADSYVSQGVPVIRGTNLTDTRALAGDFVFVSGETADALSACNVFADDLVFPHRGAIGLVGIVPDNGVRRYMLSTSLMKLTCNTELVDPRFVFYYFRSARGRNSLLEHASTVGTPGIGQPLASLRSIAIPVPPMREQRAITHILGTLDDKIELNRRTSETLEQMARALFKSWFVDFDPVRAKMEGRDLGLPPEIADLFPDAFEESPLGEIPRGWASNTLAQEFRLTMGQSPPGSALHTSADGLPFYQGSSDFGFRYPQRRVFTASPTRLAIAGDTLVSVRAPVGAINMAAEDCAIGRGVAAIRHISGGRSYTFHYMNAASAVFDKYNREGTVFGSIGKQDFLRIPCLGAPPEIVYGFERTCSPLDLRIEVGERESRTLTDLRDTLLPQLISGELRVPDAERLLAAAPV
jgi:type I restriction enzyme S subunit